MPPKRNHRQKNNKPSIADAGSGAMSDCVLPQDIMFNIVTRLPVKSIHRFKAVCKPWCKLFATPKFMKSHHAQFPLVGLNFSTLWWGSISPPRNPNFSGDNSPTWKWTDVLGSSSSSQILALRPNPPLWPHPPTLSKLTSVQTLLLFDNQLSKPPHQFLQALLCSRVLMMMWRW
ncbi:hypothetical protein CASFOL_021873 [Castilleja foliolosa]|uniref:F-box domain-containing protein n=1 Tax=Castilleja foliolosa TaxID=1961234 RepID=A0ABD3D0J3_9LAMI